MGVMSMGGDDSDKSANDDFMDSWARDDPDDYDDNRHERVAPGLLPGALLGAGIASLCAVGIYLVAGGDSGDNGSTPTTVTYTQEGQTSVVTQSAPNSPVSHSTVTTTVVRPRQTVTVKVVQPGVNKTVTTTGTTTVSAPPQTTTVTTTVTQSLFPRPPGPRVP